MIFKLANLGFNFYDDKDSNFARFTKRVEGKYFVQVIFELKARVYEKPDLPDPTELNEQIMMETFKQLQMTENINDQMEMNRQEKKQTLKDEEDPFDGKLDQAGTGTYFIVQVNRQDNPNQAMIYHCMVHDDEVQINRVQFVNDITEISTVRSFEERFNEKNSLEFHFLSQDLQKDFVEFLFLGLGVPPEIGLLVEYYAVNKEQRMYFDWLKKMQSLFN